MRASVAQSAENDVRNVVLNDASAGTNAVLIAASVAMIDAPTAVKSKEGKRFPVKTMLVARMTDAALMEPGSSATIVLNRRIRASAGNSAAPIAATAAKKGAQTGVSDAKIAALIGAKGPMNEERTAESAVKSAEPIAGTVATTGGRTVENGVKNAERTAGIAAMIAGPIEETVAITGTLIVTGAATSGALTTGAIGRAIVRADAINGAMIADSTVTIAYVTEATVRAASTDIIQIVTGGSFITRVTILTVGYS